MKNLSVLVLILLSACQQAAAPEGVQIAEIKKGIITTFSAPASDDVLDLDLTRLPEGFPVLSELEVSAKPKGCVLSKANRFAPASQGQDVENSYVFTAIGEDAPGLFQVSINGELRTLKETGAADTDDRQVRFFKTIAGDEVEVMVSVSAEGEQQTGIVGRVKAWDEGMPLMCGYNRIEVIGDCEL